MKLSRIFPILSLFTLSSCATMQTTASRIQYGEPPVEEGTAGGAWPERASQLSDRSRGLASDAIDRAKSGAQSTESGFDSLNAEDKKYKNGVRATKDDFVDDAVSEGSLWASDGQTNYYFTKNKSRGVGDIINVTIEDQLIKDMNAEIKRTLTEDEQRQEVATNEKLKSVPAEGAQAAPQPAPSSPVAGSGVPPVALPEKPLALALAEVDLVKNGSLAVKSGDLMMAEIIERYPNGNYRIRASKRVPFKNQTKLVSFIGIARGQDINETENIASGKFYEYRIKAGR